MDLFLDEHMTACDFTPEAALAELIHETKTTLGEVGRILVGIECDGIDVTGEGFAKALQTPLSKISRIDLHSANPRVLVTDAMTTAGQLLTASEQSAAEIVALLSQGDISKALTKLGECCNGWLQVHQGVCNSIVMLGLDPTDFAVEGKMLPEMMAVPCEQLQQIKDVVTANDYVLLSDILTYEFPAAVKCWRAIIKTLSKAPVAAPA